ncbi:MAG: PEP-CTERM sorting domain-containing protein [Pirellulales bacterium]
MTRNVNTICLSTLSWALLMGVNATPAVAVTIDFEGLANGQHLDTPFEVSPLFNITASETDSPGPAIFDSSPLGPNAGGLDPDLLIDSGNLLILQEREDKGVDYSGKTGDNFDLPNDAAHGGTITFDFVLPVGPTSVDLVDIDPDSHVEVRLTDTSGRRRIYEVPDDWTTDITDAPQGWQRLDLTTLASQPSEPNATGDDATVSQDAGFLASQVVQIEFAFTGSAAIDNLNLIPEPTTASLFLSGVIAFSLSRRRSAHTSNVGPEPCRRFGREYRARAWCLANR